MLAVEKAGPSGALVGPESPEGAIGWGRIGLSDRFSIDI